MATHILFLIAALCITSLSADDVFVSIDCGSSDTYTDQNLIPWTGDSDFIRTGESHAVQTKSTSSPVLDTLRAFTGRSKSCYSIPAGKGTRVLVRPTFYYGNYDRKGAPPSFDLLLDGNLWTRVQTSASDYVYYEAIYVAKGDAVDVCVAQSSPGQIPFVSSLEVRSFILAMYDKLDNSFPLYLLTRTAYGANGTIRYVDDPFDRIWVPELAVTGLTTVASNALQFGVSSPNGPPPAVLKNAISAVSPRTIQLRTGFPAVAVPVYFCMYFSEVRPLQRTERRAFDIFMDDVSLMDQPIVPPYENVTEITGWNYTVSSNTTLVLAPTNDSTLAPIINALEVFMIGDAMVDGTNAKDVDGLSSLQEAFPALQDWRGDPCLPAPYSWDWINCTDDPTPRVTALYLSSFGLSGKLPDFSSMDALQTIDFHNNSLDGAIPEFLAKLTNLKQLNLGSNQFSGPVPASLSRKAGLNLVVTGNPNVCTSGNSCNNNPTVISSSPAGRGAKKKSSKLPIILGVAIPIFVIIWAVIGVVTIFHYRRKAAAVAALTSSGANPGTKDENNVEMGGDHHGSTGRSSISD